MKANQIEFEPVTPTTPNPAPKAFPKTLHKVFQVSLVIALVIGAYLLGARSCKATCRNSLIMNSKTTQISKSLFQAAGNLKEPNSEKITTNQANAYKKEQKLGLKQGKKVSVAHPTKAQNIDKTKEILLFAATPLDKVYYKPVEVNAGAVFFVIGFWSGKKPKMAFDFNPELQTIIETETLSFRRIRRNEKENFVWLSLGYYDKDKIERLAKMETGLIGCIAGQQFEECGVENYACTTILPVPGYKSELIKPGNLIGIGYFMDSQCNLHAFMTPRKY